MPGEKKQQPQKSLEVLRQESREALERARVNVSPVEFPENIHFFAGDDKRNDPSPADLNFSEDEKNNSALKHN